MNSGRSNRGFIEIFPSVRGRRWIQNDRIPYRDELGDIIGVICLAIDINELRDTEDKLRYLSFYDVLTVFITGPISKTKYPDWKTAGNFRLLLSTLR